MSKVKLKAEHLLEIEELSKMRVNLKNQLASIQATEIELQNSKDVARVSYNKVKAYEIELGKKLTNIYGNGRMNLDTKEFISE
tara:strand:- start:105 stop:353 length:249 start_codon:yes stop_codon:yes gene_type:complete